MSDDDVAAFLDGERRAYVATINVDGTPHVVPLSYVLIDGLLTFWTDPGSRKVANLRRDARMTCLVEAGEHFAEFRAVQLTGRAELVEDHTSSERVGLALFERAHGQLTAELATPSPRSSANVLPSTSARTASSPGITASWPASARARSAGDIGLAPA